ncbi:MAG TPA: polysaccharide deacetylase family protein [Vicinamibacteria bacterium]|jgi:peptidoglycan/xylan/chitin deacetylase (PgdA/CDA1 family)
MRLRTLARNAFEALEVPQDILLGRYPEFVTGGPLARGDIPIFVFHSLEPVSFERRLRYLAENGYRSLSAEELFYGLMGATKVRDRAVALTFDDGRGSLFGVGLPLMRRYGFRGIVFLVPGRVPTGGGLPPTWDEVEAGRVPPERVLDRESDSPLLSWVEIEAMARSGLFDFQSHTLTHSRIHTHAEVTGFVTPRSRRGYEAFDTPLGERDGRDLLAEDLPLGTPLLRSAPRTSEALRFYENPELHVSCQVAVKNGGGERFFERPDWEPLLLRLVEHRRITGRHETPEEREVAIRAELLDSKRVLEERLGRPVLHVCYPWHTAGPTARRLAREVGYRCGFAGKVPGVPIARPGVDPLFIPRVGEDYIELLPGRGRARLSAILYDKWSRRFGRPVV